MTDEQWKELTKQLRLILDRLEQVELSVTAISAVLNHRYDELEQRVEQLEKVA